MTTIAEVASARLPPSSPRRIKAPHLQDAPPLKFEGTPPSCSPTSTVRATPPLDAEKATARRVSSPALTPRDSGSLFDEYAATTASADTGAEAVSPVASTHRNHSSPFDRHKTITVHLGAEDAAAAADEELAAQALPPPPSLPGGDAIHVASRPRHPPLGLLQPLSSSPFSPVNDGRRPGALKSLARSEKGLALFASSTWSNDGVAADTVPTLPEEAARRWRAESTARRKAMQKKTGVLRFITTRSWDDPAWRVGPKKRRLGAGNGDANLDGAEAGRLAPAFCCTTPVVEPAPHAARTWDTFPPGKEEFAHVIRDPAARRPLAAAAAAAARGRSTPEAEVKEEGGVPSPTASAAASAAAAVSLFNTAALAAGEVTADSPSRAAVLDGLVLPCGPSEDEKVRERGGCLACFVRCI